MNYHLHTISAFMFLLDISYTLALTDTVTHNINFKLLYDLKILIFILFCYIPKLFKVGLYICKFYDALNRGLFLFQEIVN